MVVDTTLELHIKFNPPFGRSDKGFTKLDALHNSSEKLSDNIDFDKNETGFKCPLDENTDRQMEILKVAAQIFCEKGFNATSVNDIADAMKLTKAGLYHYIESKQQLLYEIMSLGLHALEREVIEPSKTAATAVERLKMIIYYHALQVAAGNHAVTIISDEVKALSQREREEITARRKSYFNFVRNTLNEIKEEGMLNDVDTTVATYSMVGMILWVSRRDQPGGQFTPDDVSREVSKIAFNALLVR